MFTGLLKVVGREGRRMSGRALSVATRAALIAVVVAANIAGGCVVFALGLLVLPSIDVGDPGTVRLVNAGVAAAYLIVAVAAGLLIGFRYGAPVRIWLVEERDPDERAQRCALRGPQM